MTHLYLIPVRCYCPKEEGEVCFVAKRLSRSRVQYLNNFLLVNTHILKETSYRHGWTTSGRAYESWRNRRKQVVCAVSVLT